MSNMIVARRKGSRVRYFDPRTARMGKWEPAPRPPRLTTGFLSRRTVAELRSMAGPLGIKTTTKSRKADIIRALLEV
jgi:hypothetical protein